MKLEELTNILAVAAQLFPNAALSTAHYWLWHSLFANDSADAFSRALQVVLKEPGRKWFPTPGEVNAVLAESKKTEAERMTSVEAWNAVVERAEKNPPKGFPAVERSAARKFPRLHAALMAIGGLERVRFADESEIQWVRKAFIEAYHELEQAEISNAQIREMEKIAPTPQVKALLPTTRALPYKVKG